MFPPVASHLTTRYNDRVAYCLKPDRGRSPGFNEPAKRAKRTLQVVNGAEVEGQTSADRSPIL